MIEVRIAALSVDSRTNQPVVMLRPLDTDDDRVLPIWIGHPEATSIMIALEDAEPARPLTHDLFKTVIETLDAFIERVEIVRVEEGTFYAALVLRAEDRTLAIDARPSDSIALALRFRAPIFVDEAVLDDAGVPYEDIAEEPKPEDEDAEIEAFRQFLESVDPSEFEAS